MVRPFKQNSKLDTKGFTMVELMVVSALVGLMASILLVSFQRNVHDERLRSVSRSLLETLLETQTRARQENIPIEVQLNHTNGTVQQSDITDITNPITLGTIDLSDSIEGLQRLKICSRTSTIIDTFACDEFNDGSDLDSTSQPRSSVTMVFTPRGTVSVGGLVKLHLPQATRTRCVAVLTPIGMIREGRDDGTCCNFDLNL
jgi:prepilin-type N-terminal cleavage/methylation domain-containing protein